MIADALDEQWLKELEEQVKLIQKRAMIDNYQKGLMDKLQWYGNDSKEIEGSK